MTEGLKRLDYQLRYDADGTIPQAASRPAPFTQGSQYSTTYREFWAPEGAIGEKQKSVKNRAALLHGLAFLLLDHIFGVLRGEQPLRRGPLPRNSGTFFATFFGHKKGRPW